jgi:signal transduction histidine kinase
MRNPLLLFLLLYLNPVFGQSYSSFWYNSENGLPQNSIKDITKDKYGFIWIATEGGIVRYDGQSILAYKNQKLSNLNFAYFKGNISEDMILNNNNEEQQYILIKNRKISIQNPKLISKKFTFNNYFNNKRYFNITKKGLTFYMDRAYFINTKDGVYLFEDDKIIYKKDKESKDKIVLQSTKIKDLKHFFLHKETLFIKLPEEKNFIAIKNGNISQVVADPLYNDPDSRIFWQQISDQVFIFNQGNIYKSEYIDGKLKFHLIIHLKNNEIDFGTLSSMFYDKEYNNLYLGTISQGLCLIKISSFHTPRTETSLENRIYYTTLPFSINSIINTQGRVFDDKTLVKDFHFTSKKDFYTIADDDSGNILIPANNYLKRILKNSGYQKTDSIKLNTSVQAIFKDKGMYALQLNYFSPYILNIYNNDRFEKPEYVLTSTSAINAVRVIDHDKLMIGRDNGLFILSKSKKTLKQLSDLNIKNIVLGNDRNYWIISRGKGFYLLKNNKLTKMPYDENGYIYSPHNVLEDKNGFLWIPTNNGLFKVLKTKLLEYANNKKTDVFYYRYSKGFNTNEFNGTGSIYNIAILPNGNFVLPSMDGYVFFDPLKVSAYYPKAENIYIERAKSKGPDIFYFKDTLHLENDFNIASVYIDVPYYSNNDNLYIEASLQNGNNPTQWQRLKNKEYTLSNLSPGNYTLQVRVLISPDGKFAYKKILITIPALFYQTLWFRIVVIGSFLGLISLIILLRTRILTTKNNQLKKIVHQKNDELKTTQSQLKNESDYQKNLIQTINHDITTPIKYLSVMSQKLSETDNPKLQKQYYDTIYKSSEELYKFTLSLKNYTELFNNESKAFQEGFYFISDILETKKRLFEEIASQKNTVIINNSSKNIKLNFNESIIAAVIHNLLDNAVKNTFGGEIVMNAKTEENLTTISISDTGTGMSDELLEYYNNLIKNIQNKPSSFKNHGLGLHLVVQLLKKIGGKIIFKNNIPKGTKVKIVIKNQS